MTNAPLTSPVGAYKPEVLMLAPPEGEDLNTLSLLSQFIELGVALELDENWRLPTAPPKDLSAYRACVFPDHPDIVKRYEADLDAYFRAGGFMPYFKYYPLDGGATGGGVHHYFRSFGRDDYMYHAANVTLEAGLTVPNEDFRAALRARDLQSMVDEYRQQYVSGYAGKTGRWGSWGDPQYTQFLVNFHLARSFGDDEWLAVVAGCVQRLCDTVPEYLADHYPFQELKIPDAVQCQAAIMAEVLIDFGHQLQRSEWMEAGLKLARFYFDHAVKRGDIYQEPYHHQVWSETLYTLPTMIALSRFDGRTHLRGEADLMMREVTKRNQTAEGLWRHWTDDAGGKGACWSRGTQWAMLWPTRALMMLEEPSGVDVEFIAQSMDRTLHALARHQDKATGLWHLVVDEPDTRLESSGTAGIIYCHDRLRDMGLIGDVHQPMIDRAVDGLKAMWYHAGLAGNCRGTSTGVANYYRTRPVGYYKLTVFPAAFPARMAE